MTNVLIRLFIKDYSNVENLKVRKKYGILSGVTGILCNIALFVAKLIAGILTASISIMADAFNNLSDAASSIVTLVGFNMVSKPADAKHPFGYGRVEYISGLVVSIVIMIMGLEFVETSIEKIITPESVEIDVVSISILVVSVLIKLWLSLFYKKVGTKINSSTIKAISKDSIADVVTTSTVLIGALVSYTTGKYIDGYVGVLVALFIIYTGFTTARETLSPLLGQAPDKELINKIERKILSYEDIVGIHDLIVHNYGVGRSLVSLHAEVPANMDIMKIHETIDAAERGVKRELNCDIVIHMDPIVTDDVIVNSTQKIVKKIVHSIDEKLSIHDFRMVKSESFTNLIFDITAPYKFNLSDEKLVELIGKKVKELNSTYNTVINIDRIDFS